MASGGWEARQSRAAFSTDSVTTASSRTRETEILLTERSLIFGNTTGLRPPTPHLPRRKDASPMWLFRLARLLFRRRALIAGVAGLVGWWKNRKRETEEGESSG